jgi:hypothetical protein
MAWADQATQMMLGHDCAKEEFGGTQRLSATQLAPISRGAQILRQSFKGRARSLCVEDRSKLWRAWRLGNCDTKERSGVFPDHQPQQAESQLKERDFGNLRRRVSGAERFPTTSFYFGTAVVSGVFRR